MHGFGPHTAVSVSVPALHDLDPDSEYPALHVGEQLDPLASELVQPPPPPFVGGADALHGFAEHVAAASVPSSSHTYSPTTVYPSVHVGEHFDPISSDPVHSNCIPVLAVIVHAHLVMSPLMFSSPEALVVSPGHFSQVLTEETK